VHHSFVFLAPGAIALLNTQQGTTTWAGIS